MVYFPFILPLDLSRFVVGPLIRWQRVNFFQRHIRFTTFHWVIRLSLWVLLLEVLSIEWSLPAMSSSQSLIMSSASAFNKSIMILMGLSRSIAIKGGTTSALNEMGRITRSNLNSIIDNSSSRPSSMTQWSCPRWRIRFDLLRESIALQSALNTPSTWTWNPNQQTRTPRKAKDGKWNAPHVMEWYAMAVMKRLFNSPETWVIETATLPARPFWGISFDNMVVGDSKRFVSGKLASYLFCSWIVTFILQPTTETYSVGKHHWINWTIFSWKTSLNQLKRNQLWGQLKYPDSDWPSPSLSFYAWKSFERHSMSTNLDPATHWELRLRPNLHLLELFREWDSVVWVSSQTSCVSAMGETLFYYEFIFMLVLHWIRQCINCTMNQQLGDVKFPKEVLGVLCSKFVVDRFVHRVPGPRVWNIECTVYNSSTPRAKKSSRVT